jgi:hypothetical protein
MTALRLLGIAHASTTAAEAMIIGPVAAVLDDADDAATLADRVRSHHRRVVAQCRRGAFLPAPYGLVFDEAGALERTIADAGADLLRDLDRFANMVEWSVRIETPRATMPAELTPGRAFLAERQAAAAAVAAGRQMASRLNGARAPLPVMELLADATEDGTVRVTLLASAGTARTAIEAAWTMLAATTIGDSIAAGHRPAGPWPPYRFVALRHRLATDGARSAGEVIDDNAA